MDPITFLQPISKVILTHWPLRDLNVILKLQFLQSYFIDWSLQIFQRECPPMNATGPI